MMLKKVGKLQNTSSSAVVQKFFRSCHVHFHAGNLQVNPFYDWTVVMFGSPLFNPINVLAVLPHCDSIVVRILHS